MSILIGFLTAVLVLNCLFLILLILIQLPKKDAGAGLAFGGGATEALFGAGSGTVLTKVTKYSAGFFMGMALLLSVLNAHQSRSSARAVELELERAASQTSAPQATPTGTVPTPAPPLLQSTVTNIAPLTPAPAETAAPEGQP